MLFKGGNQEKSPRQFAYIKPVGDMKIRTIGAVWRYPTHAKKKNNNNNQSGGIQLVGEIENRSARAT